MKTIKILFAAILLFLMAYGNSGAQTRQVKTTEPFSITINCNGEPELILGQFEVHYVVSIKEDDGLYYLHFYKRMAITGEAVSQSTGEVFRANYIEMHDPYLPGTVFYHSRRMNLVGDRGTHLMFTIVLKYDYTGDEPVLTIDRLKEKCL